MQQRHREQASTWQRLTLATCLLALAVLAPTLWREVQSFRGNREDAMLAAITRDADSRLGMTGTTKSPELDESARIEPSSARPLDSLTASSDVASEPLADRKALLADRVGRGFAELSPDSSSVDADQEALQFVLSTPAPTVQDEVLLAGQSETVAPNRSHWTVPFQLLKELKELGETTACRGWTLRTATTAQWLGSAESPQEVEPLLQQLRTQLAAADALLDRINDVSLASRVKRVQHALERRLDVWHGVLDVQRQDASKVSHPYHLERLADMLAKADEFVLSTADGDGWRRYLLLAELRELARREPAPTDEQTAALIRRAVARMQARGLMARQRRYLRSRSLIELQAELRRVIDEPVDTARLLTLLEAYEADGQPSVAEEIAEVLGRLTRSLRPEEQRLAQHIERHYRSPNLRVSLSQELLARVAPRQQPPQVRAVSDTIMGVPISGQATTSTQLRARLLPGQGDVLRVELQASGVVDSNATGRAGSVTTFTQTQSRYVLSKVLEFRNDGIAPQPVRVRSVRSNTDLNDLRTDWDAVPLIGGWVRSSAVSEYEQTEAQRRAEVERKVASRAVSEFERQAAQAISRLNREYVKHVMVPLYRLELEPELVAEPQRDDRMTLRVRLANEHQLGCNTPRPLALADSLASMQVHESLINNVAEQLHLDGRTMNGAELLRHVSAKLSVKLQVDKKEPAVQPSDEKPTRDKAERVQFTFAQQDAVRARLVDGQLVLTVSVDLFEAGGRRWKNFRIVVPYELRPVDTTVELVQVGEASFLGRISAKSQLILRGIMTNFFDKDRTFRILADVMSDDRLAGTRVILAEITDGWIGLCLGSKDAE